jgi:pimeloyl-ACP methyl ester carboxylesterase
MARIVFLHGLESITDENLYPIGRKAVWLRNHYSASTPGLDTRSAIKHIHTMDNLGKGWNSPFHGEDEAFQLPMERAREVIGEDTKLVIGSSFGGAVLLRLIHETPNWNIPALFLAGAGLRLTKYKSLPEGLKCRLIHGKRDGEIPLEDSICLANSSETATLVKTNDDHSLDSIIPLGVLRESITILAPWRNK